MKYNLNCDEKTNTLTLTISTAYDDFTAEQEPNYLAALLAFRVLTEQIDTSKTDRAEAARELAEMINHIEDLSNAYLRGVYADGDEKYTIGEAAYRVLESMEAAAETKNALTHWVTTQTPHKSVEEFVAANSGKTPMPLFRMINQGFMLSFVGNEDFPIAYFDREALNDREWFDERIMEKYDLACSIFALFAPTDHPNALYSANEFRKRFATARSFKAEVVRHLYLMK